jgi:DNA-binding response OmpR family regulator
MDIQFKILIVEDDPDINGLLVKILKDAEYQTVQAFSGTEAKLLLEKEMPDLILLDLMLPGISGEDLLNDIRNNKNDITPVIVISAKKSLGDKVALLKSGADDYITKPFEPEEVVARVQTALRRIGKEACLNNILKYKNIMLYPQSRKVIINKTEIDLTAREYDILYLFMQNPEKVYSRESLYELVWHGGYYGENNTVNVHVSNLRKKLKEADSKEDYIKTVYGIGFQFR